MASHVYVTGVFDKKKRAKRVQERVYANRTLPLEMFNDDNIVNRYRLSREAIQDIIDLCQHDLQRATQRSNPLNPDLQVMITLRYLGKGGFQS